MCLKLCQFLTAIISFCIYFYMLAAYSSSGFNITPSFATSIKTSWFDDDDDNDMTKEFSGIMGK